jgi:hypothetical protein
MELHGSRTAVPAGLKAALPEFSGLRAVAIKIVWFSTVC